MNANHRSFKLLTSPDLCVTLRETEVSQNSVISQSLGVMVHTHTHVHGHLKLLC